MRFRRHLSPHGFRGRYFYRHSDLWAVAVFVNQFATGPCVHALQKSHQQQTLSSQDRFAFLKRLLHHAQLANIAENALPLGRSPHARDWACDIGPYPSWFLPERAGHWVLRVEHQAARASYAYFVSSICRMGLPGIIGARFSWGLRVLHLGHAAGHAKNRAGIY